MRHHGAAAHGRGLPAEKVAAEASGRRASAPRSTTGCSADRRTAPTGSSSAALPGTQPKLRDVRDALAAYLGDTADATTLGLDGLDDAGVPATPKGTKAADTLTDSFKKIRTSLRELQDQAEDISIKHEAKALKQVKALERPGRRRSSHRSPRRLAELADAGPQPQAARSRSRPTRPCQALSG